MSKESSLWLTLGEPQVLVEFPLLGSFHSQIGGYIDIYECSICHVLVASPSIHIQQHAGWHEEGQ